MNEYDSNRILELTKKINFFSTSDVNEADCYVLNTCHIREKATEKVYHHIGRIKKKFKDKKKPIVIIAGCVAQAEGEVLLKKEKYIDAVIGPQSYHEINNIILEKNKAKNLKVNKTEFDVIRKFDELNLIKNRENKVSSFLTIQEGCDKFCKFCVVPYTRGPEHSRSFSEVINEADQLIENGTKEIILLGQNVNAYNYKGKKISDLIYELNKKTKLERIRYTTSHPNDFSDDLVEAHRDCKKLMPILHLPIQSGSSYILKKMNRNHTREEYFKILDKLLKVNSSMKFSSDFIIAYPGETQDDFEKTISLIQKVKFINSYSYIYSERPGTPAAKLKKINEDVAKERLVKFQIIANEIKKNYRQGLVNSFVKVLFENKSKDKNSYFGRDEYFNSVMVKSSSNLCGLIKNVKVKDWTHNTLYGELNDASKPKEFAA